MPLIQKLTAAQGQTLLPQLVALLQDAVQDGASIGFTHPLVADVAELYWQDVLRDLSANTRILLIAQSSDTVLGTVQLALCTRPNGRHRAEVQKLLVHTASRRQGIARSLMKAIEQEARETQRSLLYLDTESGKPAASMYAQLGWLRAGEIPDYASTPDGHLHGTTIFYRRV